MKRILPLLLCLLPALSACIFEARIDDELIGSDTPCLKVKGRMAFLYDEATGQLGYVPARHEFRTGNDDMSDFFILRCDTAPKEEGQTVTASLTWFQNYEVQKRDGIPFKVEKITDDGTVWLWNGKESIGAVVRILP